MLVELPEHLKIDFPLDIGKIVGALSREDVRRWLIERDVDVTDIRMAEQGLMKIAAAFYYKEPASFKDALAKIE